MSLIGSLVNFSLKKAKTAATPNAAVTNELRQGISGFFCDDAELNLK